MKIRLDGLVLYLVIGISLVAGIVALAALRPDISVEQFRVWFAFGYFTVVLGLVLAKMYWSVRKSTKAWLLFAVFMALHIAGYALLLQRGMRWPAIFYVVTGPFEVMLFAALAKVVLDLLPPKVNL